MPVAPGTLQTKDDPEANDHPEMTATLGVVGFSRPLSEIGSANETTAFLNDGRATEISKER